jgi:anaerobic selenocysteine-containing dehydrogenase
MKRIGPRGSGQYKSITWDEALKELADRINGLRQQGKPEALAAVDAHPLRSSMALMIKRLLKAIGSPNHVRVPRVEDTYVMVNSIMQGTEGPMAYDLENADFILSFGAGLIEGWGSPGRMLNAWGLWREAALQGKIKVVQIDSRASNTASKADQWLAPRPGTESALALGMAHVIIKEGLYDTRLVHEHTFGFTDWKSALCGKGKGNLNGSLLEFMAVQGLNALVGNINKPGGALVHDPLPLGPWPDVNLDATARQGLKKRRIDMAGGEKYPFAQSLINNMAQAVLSSSSSAVDTLLIFSGNPAYTLPDGGAFKNALKRVPYIVSFSPYRDETSYMADLILPDHTYLEKTNDIVWPPGLQYPLYALSQPVVEPVYDTRNSGDVIIQLGKMIGGTVGATFPWENFEASIKARVKGLFESGDGLTSYEDAPPVWKGFAGRKAVRSDYKSFDEMWGKLKGGGFWYRPTHRFGGWESLFQTPSGRFEFFSSTVELAVNKLAQGSSVKSALENMGIKAEGDEAFMPHYEVPVPLADEKDYPLLMVPYEFFSYSTDWLPNPPYLKKTIFDNQLKKNESFAEINPKTASKYGLKQGDRVTVQSPRGEIKVRVNLFEGAMPGVVFLPLGFGHTAYDDFQRGQGVSPNEILDGKTDPLSGQMVWWDTHVRLIKT